MVPTLAWRGHGLSQSCGWPWGLDLYYPTGWGSLGEAQSAPRPRPQGLSYLGPAHLDPRPRSPGSPSQAEVLACSSVPCSVRSEGHSDPRLPAFLSSGGDEALLGAPLHSQGIREDMSTVRCLELTNVTFSGKGTLQV